jgi:hypothetical protein
MVRKRVELLYQNGPHPFAQAYGDGRQLLAPLRTLKTDAAAARDLEQRMRSTVQELRAGGVSWAVIGNALGITKQAAQQRYGHDTLI